MLKVSSYHYYHHFINSNICEMILSMISKVFRLVAVVTFWHVQ